MDLPWLSCRVRPWHPAPLVFLAGFTLGVVGCDGVHTLEPGRACLSVASAAFAAMMMRVRVNRARGGRVRP